MIPGGDFHPWLFLIVAVWVLLCALGVVLSRRVTYSAVAMVFCFLGVAFAYALLHAELVAIMQLLVYVGAISIVVIFAIMLTDVQDGDFRQFFNRQTIVAALLAAVAAIVIASAVVVGTVGDTEAVVRNPGVGELSRLLFHSYVLPFELISLVLVAAMIGAIVLARKQGERR